MASVVPVLSRCFAPSARQICQQSLSAPASGVELAPVCGPPASFVFQGARRPGNVIATRQAYCLLPPMLAAGFSARLLLSPARTPTHTQSHTTNLTQMVFLADVQLSSARCHLPLLLLRMDVDKSSVELANQGCSALLPVKSALLLRGGCTV